jgi:hypothetical protein
MWRNLMRTHTDATRVDLKRPRFDRSHASDDTVPDDTIPQATLPDDFDDDDDDATTMLQSRLNWPEPPRDFAERRRVRAAAMGRAFPTGLSRTLGRTLGGHHAPYWRAFGFAAIVAAAIPMLFGRARPTSPVANGAADVAQDAAPRPIPSSPVAVPSQPATQPPPQLIITVGPAGGVAPVVAPTATKPPISVSRLPIAPRPSVSPPATKLANRPVGRVSAPRAPAAGTATRTPGVTPAQAPVINDGF